MACSVAVRAVFCVAFWLIARLFCGYRHVAAHQLQAQEAAAVMHLM